MNYRKLRLDFPHQTRHHRRRSASCTALARSAACPTLKVGVEVDGDEVIAAIGIAESDIPQLSQNLLPTSIWAPQLEQTAPKVAPHSWQNRASPRFRAWP